MRYEHIVKSSFYKLLYFLLLLEKKPLNTIILLFKIHINLILLKLGCEIYPRKVYQVIYLL